MTCILGIDPGSRATGYGLINQQGNETRLVSLGTIVTTQDDFPSRLGEIFHHLQQVAQQYPPDEIAIERVFLARNPDSALKLGQARGAAIVALAGTGAPVFEYSARQIKQAVVGQGGAVKSQVASMVKMLLKLDEIPQADAADALAVALCHSHMRIGLARLAGARGIRKRRMR